MLHRALRKGGLRRGYPEVEVDIVLEPCGKNLGFREGGLGFYLGWGLGDLLRRSTKAGFGFRLGCCLGDLLGIRRIGGGSEIG